MYKNREKEIIQNVLNTIGITINGSNPYDLHIHNEDFYGRVLRHGSLGFGESYVDGWWDCEALDHLFHKLLEADLSRILGSNWNILFGFAWSSILNSGRKSKAFEVGEKHYDIGNDLYSVMLDKRMAYTCGYWKDAKTVDEAQEAKLDLVCKKIGLTHGQKVLDIGSGWGSFIGYAAEKYGAVALGVTVSKEQKKLSDERYTHMTVETLLQDYRDIRNNEKFDHIVSLGMLEHVGYKNYRTFMEVVHTNLRDDGLFLLQTIGGNRSGMETDPWIEKYIFPNGMVPSAKQIIGSVEKLFVIEDWHNFGSDYDKTLMAWHKNFESNWNSIQMNHTERFYRMWRYYLLSCAGSFRARENQLWQIVLSKRGVSGGYKSIR